MNRPNFNHTFLQEAEELLGQIEEIVLSVCPGAPAGEPIHHLFRAFHTLKGSGAMFGFDTVAAFTHHVETVLDKVRDGTLPVSEELVNLILASKDQIKALLEAAQDGPPVAAEDGQKIIAALNALLPKASANPSVTDTEHVAAATAKPDTARSDAPKIQTYRVGFRPNPGLLASGTNPMLLLDELRGLGQCTLQAKTEAIPALEQLQPDQCYLGWDITLATERGLDAIKDVFIFVEGECDLTIEPVAAGVSPAAEGGIRPAGSVGETSGSAAGVQTPISPSVTPSSTAGGTPAPTAEARVAGTRKPSAKDATVRVPSERLDRLVALVGEMVMNQSRLTQVAAAAELPTLAAPVEELERLVGELRDTVLGIRMMPIGTTFSRYKRLVHDLSSELGKEIDLITEGAETELDKTVLDQLGDPLIHLIRNSIDHGVEPREARERAGKPGRGTIRLVAAHTGSNVVVTIQDDGRGLDTEVIRAKAVEKQLIAPDTAMSREEIYNLIFLPGFSTAKQVTSVSGRGVGMDVVRRQMDTLRGTIRLASELGKGTTVSLTLPLTLAIIDGLLVEIGPDKFIVPMSAVTENVEISRADRSRKNGRNLVAVRGELIPYIRLRDHFGMVGGELEIEKIVIVRHGSERVGLVVDRVLGSHQTVIQSMGRFYRNIDVVSGATIMGDGRVALILELSGLIRLTQNNRPASVDSDTAIDSLTHS